MTVKKQIGYHIKGLKMWWNGVKEYIQHTQQGWNFWYPPSYNGGDEEDWVCEMEWRARFFIMLSEIIIFAVASLGCCFKGHDLKDNSYGGPDHGCFDFHCKRCGVDFHHSLY